MSAGHCRSCGSALARTFCDLGMSPLSNAFLKPAQLQHMEPFYPLHAYVCETCFLVQLQQFETPQQIFGEDYAYFSSYSETWLQHAREYTDYMIKRFSLGAAHHVVEIASNDGYLLQYFHAKKIHVLGIEPAANVARVAQAAGIPTAVKFFGLATARELLADGKQADLLLGNNVLAHVPDVNDFVAGLALLLKPGGIITMEFPHLLRLMQHNQFDTIYHEHFSYFSFFSVEKIFARHGLKIFDVESLSTHGGSLRIFAARADDPAQLVSAAVGALHETESKFGIRRLGTYDAFADRVRQTKRSLLAFLIEAKAQAKTVAAYGAAAKGNTLLNYCGVREDFIDYVVDRSPHKQGCFLPGTHIPVHAPEKIALTRPDYLLILPWNLRDEIVSQMGFIRDWGGKFVVPIPQVEVIA